MLSCVTVLKHASLLGCAQHAERLSASRLVLVGSDEWARGTVSVKDLALRDQKEMSVEQLLALVPQPSRS